MEDRSIIVQPQMDIESDEARAPLLPIAADPAPPTGDETTNCCMIACCAPLSINGSKGGKPDKPGPDPKPPVVAHNAWAHAFKLNVALTLAAAVWFGGMAIEALKNDTLSGEGRRRLMHSHVHGHAHHGEDHEEGGAHLTNAVFGGFTMVLIASLVSGGMLHSLFHCGRGFLHGAYSAFVGLFAGVATVFLLFGAVFPAVVFFAIFALGASALRRRKHRIAFGSANLKVASLAIKEMPWTYRSAILMGIVQFLWCGVAMIAALGSFIALETVTASDGSSHPAIKCLANLDLDDSPDGIATVDSSCMCSGVKISDEECEFSGLGLPLTIVWLCSMVWGCGVIKNVVACTVSGSVASWWFSPSEDASPVKGAYHRATTTSFGSLCKAAAVQQVISLVSAIAQRVMRVVPCASMLMSWVDRAARYVISYTVAFVGIYGLSFSEAGGRVREMFQRRAVTTLANDVVVEVGLALLATSALFVYALMTGMMMFGAFAKVFGGDNANKDPEELMDTVEFWSVMGPQIFGAVSLVFLVTTVLEVVRSGFKAVFVCFVQDPEVLAEKHGHEMHAELDSAWKKMHDNIRSSNTATATATSTSTSTSTTTEGLPVHNGTA